MVDYLPTCVSDSTISWRPKPNLATAWGRAGLDPPRLICTGRCQQRQRLFFLARLATWHDVTGHCLTHLSTSSVPPQTYIAALEKQLRALKNSGVEPPAPPMSPAATGVAGASGAGEGGPADPSSPAGAAGSEGVRPPQDEEAANAIRLLTKRSRELQAEVDEEKAEVKRRCVRACVRAWVPASSLSRCPALVLRSLPCVGSLRATRFTPPPKEAVGLLQAHDGIDV